jgi:hypothetical protein
MELIDSEKKKLDVQTLADTVTSGLIAELKGEMGRVREMLHIKGIEDICVDEMFVTSVWKEDPPDDVVGDFVDFVLVENNNLDDVWKEIRSNNFELGRLAFTKRLKQYPKLYEKTWKGDAEALFKALDDGKRTVTKVSFTNRLFNGLAYREVPMERNHPLDGNPPSEALLDFWKVLMMKFPGDLGGAFDSLNNLTKDSKLTRQEFDLAAKKKLKWYGPAADVFAELDPEKVGYLQRDEFRKLGQYYFNRYNKNKATRNKDEETKQQETAANQKDEDSEERPKKHVTIPVVRRGKNMKTAKPSELSKVGSKEEPESEPKHALTLSANSILASAASPKKRRPESAPKARVAKTPPPRRK